jgi:hypothetical protein
MAVGGEVVHAPKLWPEYHSAYYERFPTDGTSTGGSTLRERRDHDLLAEVDRHVYKSNARGPTPESIRLQASPANGHTN